MPAYNAAKFIAAAMDSVIDQSFPDWELLITDDGSTDATRSIVCEYGAADARIRLFENRMGKGPAAARNNSMRQANGKYVAFLDADDQWKPEKLSRQIAFMEEKGGDFVYAGYDHIDVHGHFLKTIEVPESITYRALLRRNVIATATVLFRRSAFSCLEMPDFPRAQDFALWLKLLREIDCAYGIQDSLALYRATPNTGNRRKIYAVKYLYDIYTRQEGKSPWAAAALILGMFGHRMKKYAGPKPCNKRNKPA
jgi:teichuronic acid biosynthesis glycosyltransferase TuaG